MRFESHNSYFLLFWPFPCAQKWKVDANYIYCRKGDEENSKLWRSLTRVTEKSLGLDVTLRLLSGETSSPLYFSFRADLGCSAASRHVISNRILIKDSFWASRKQGRVHRVHTCIGNQNQLAMELFLKVLQREAYWAIFCCRPPPMSCLWTYRNRTEVRRKVSRTWNFQGIDLILSNVGWSLIVWRVKFVPVYTWI